MELIGGLVAWDPHEPVGPERVAAIADRLFGIGASPRRTGQGSVALVSSVTIESTERVWAVADLDLTNLAELQALAAPAEPRALLSGLWDLEGPRFVRRLRGGFAFALWDRRQRMLFLAVDQFGIKRLHYVTDRHHTAFGSRPSGLLAMPGVEGRVDLDQVFGYLNFGCVPAPASIFGEVRRLAPGHALLVREGDSRVDPYWDMRYPEQQISERAGAEGLYRLTEEAVERSVHGIAPKEVGAFLSGGTDSSTVLGMMGRVTGERVSAFSIGFQEERYNELSYAELAARHFDAAHYTHIVTAGETLALLPRLVEAYDEPFGNNSALGTFFCAQLARDCGMRWLLAGDGGDEIFGGNERYRKDRILARYHGLPGPLRRGLVEPVLHRLPERGLVGRAQRYIRRASIPNPARIYSYRFFFAREGRELLAPEFLAAVDASGPQGVIQRHYDASDARAELNRLLYLDLKVTIGDDDLLKVTRTADLAGIRVRFPLLDPTLVEFTGTLPAHFKVRGLEKRYLFKRTFQTLLPSEILTKAKHGFGVPTSVWMKTDPAFRALTRDTLLSARARQRGYFRSGALEELLARHTADSTSFYGDILWTALMLELWHLRHVDAQGTGR